MVAQLRSLSALGVRDNSGTHERNYFFSSTKSFYLSYLLDTRLLSTQVGKYEQATKTSVKNLPGNKSTVCTNSHILLPPSKQRLLLQLVRWGSPGEVGVEIRWLIVMHCLQCFAELGKDRTPSTFHGSLPSRGPKGKQKVMCRMQERLRKK